MNDYRFHLDRSKPRKKYQCPSCGRYKCFTRYVDDDGVIDFPDTVGICDHLNRCAYHYTPKDYFRDHPDAKKTVSDATKRETRHVCTTPMPEPVSYISRSIVDATMSDYSINPFHHYLCSIFGSKEADRLCRLYNVGTSRKWGGSTVYWQVDKWNSVRSGKIMLYDPMTGHRMKKADGNGYVSWAHTELRMQGFNLRQCLFGEHLLSQFPDKRVMIVEGEKSAIIASHFMDEYVWLATGGMCNLKANASLRGRDVLLLPDLGATEKWMSKIQELKSVCQSVTLYDYLDLNATPEQRQDGLDIADFLLSAPTDHMQLNDMMNSHSNLRQLVNSLDLKLIGISEPVNSSSQSG